MRIATLVAALAAASAASADTIDVNGVKRSYTAQLPGKRPAPLVVVLHGKTQRGADMVTRTAWPQVAKREGLAVVFPDGLNNAWADARTKAGPALRGPPAGTDDVAFIAKLVEKLVADGRSEARLRRRRLQWRCHGDVPGVCACRSVCGGRERDHEPQR